MSSTYLSVEALASLLETITAPFICLDRERRVTFVNAAARTLLGVTSDCLGKVYRWYDDGEDRDLTDIHSRILRGERLSGRELVRHTHDGRRLDLRVWMTPLHDADGRAVGTVAMLVDICEQRRAEKRNRLQYNVSRLLQGASEVRSTMAAVLAAIGSELGWHSGSFWNYSPEHDSVEPCVMWQASDAPLPLGKTSEGSAIPQQTLVERVCRERKPIVISNVTYTIGCACEHRCEHAPNRAVCVPIMLGNRALGAMEFYCNGAQMFDDPESLSSIMAIAGQVAHCIDRTRAQARLQASEQRLRAIVEHAGSGIGVTDSEGYIVQCNRALAEMLGYSEAELRGKHYTEFTHPDDLTAEVQLLGELFKGERESYAVEKRYVRKDGETIWTRVTITICCKDPMLLIGIVENIHTQRRLLQELQENESRYRLMVEGSEQVFFYQHDAQHRFTYLSPSVRSVIGYDPSELIDQPFERLLSGDPSDLRALELTDGALRDGERRAPYEVTVTHRRGHRVILEVIETPLRDREGNFVMHGLARDVTARKETEERLRISDEILSAVETMVVVANASGEIVYVNPYTTKLLGYPAHELLGLGWWTKTFDSVEKGRESMTRIAACARGERALIKDGAELMTAADGSKHWILWRDTRAHGDLLIGSGQDITARKLAEDALLHRTTYLNELIENSPLGIVTSDQAGFVQMCNPAFERLFQYSKEELSGTRLSDAIATADTRDEARLILEKATSGEATHLVSKRRRKDGTCRTVELHALPVRVNNNVVGSYGLYRDITDQVLVERNLRENERLLDLFFKQSVAGALFMMLDVPVHWDGSDTTFQYMCSHMRCTKVNEALAQQYATTQAEMLGTTPLETWCLATNLSNTWRKLLDDGSLEIEFEDKRRDGEMIVVEGHYSCIFDSDGRVTGVFGMQRDVTSRRKAEEALAASEQQLRAIFTSSIDGMLIFNDDGIYLDANPAACEMIGVSRDAILGRAVGTFMRDSRGGAELLNQLRTNGAAFGPNEIVRPDGAIVNVEYSATANILPGVHVSIIRDITMRRKLEQQLQQSQKMEAIGNLAGGVAHDFNNMLTVIRGYSELLLKKFAESDPLRRYAAGILNAADRAALTTQQLLAFSRRQVLHSQPVDINHVIKDMDGLIRRLIGEDIQIHTFLADDLGTVIADPGQIGQIILNLAVNSRDAMPGGGMLTIETRNVLLDETYASTHPSFKPGHYVMLSVTDTGCGIDPSIKAHVFEPFFTTKPPGKGTGLGLATIYGIVHQGRGSIYVYSEPGEGTTLKVYLPRADAHASLEQTEEALAPPRAVLRNNPLGTICVIEDEDGPRNLISDCLTSAGHTVLSARDGATALELLQDSNTHVDLILTDVMLAGMDGHDLAGYIALRHPDAAITYMSGFTKDVLVDRGALEPSSDFIGKPFTVSELIEHISRTLQTKGHLSRRTGLSVKILNETAPSSAASARS